MGDVPTSVSLLCPGTTSSTAGKDTICQGCPNRISCSTGQSKLTLHEREPEVIEAIKRRVGSIRRRIIILSGKGGVGKSTLSVCLARALSRCEDVRTNEGDVKKYRIGLLDLDLCGPSIPCMLGCMDEKVHQSQAGWSPVFVSENLSLMSVGFLLPSPDHAVIWRGPRKNNLIRQLLTEVAWTEENDNINPPATLDFLIIDTPPGTSDEHLTVLQYLQAAGCIDGALIITTPQEVALSDVRKEIDLCKTLSVPILGIIENMVEFTCPMCKFSGPLFPHTSGGASSLYELDSESSKQLELLAQLPLDARLARALDEGLCPFNVAETIEMKDETNKELCDIPLNPNDAILVALNNFVNRLLKKIEELV